MPKGYAILGRSSMVLWLPLKRRGVRVDLSPIQPESGCEGTRRRCNSEGAKSMRVVRSDTMRGYA